jgi:hypothetical protein
MSDGVIIIALLLAGMPLLICSELCVAERLEAGSVRFIENKASGLSGLHYGRCRFDFSRGGGGFVEYQPKVDLRFGGAFLLVVRLSQANMTDIAETAKRAAPAFKRYRLLAEERLRALPPVTMTRLSMSEIEKFLDHAIQARRMAAYTTDQRIRVILELLSDELEQEITTLEHRQASDAETRSAP